MSERDRLPIFPLRTVLYPGGFLPLHIFEPRYRRMISRCHENEPCFGVVLLRRGSEVGERPPTHAIGTSATILEHITLADGRSNLLVKGERRFEIIESDWDLGYMVATVDWLESASTPGSTPDVDDTLERIQHLLSQYIAAYNRSTGQQATLGDFSNDGAAFAYEIASSLPLDNERRQLLLEARPLGQLLALLEETIRRETALLMISGSVSLSDRAGGRFTSN